MAIYVKSNLRSHKFRRAITGSTMIEMVFTLPIIIYSMLFLIETIRLNNIQSSLDQIATHFAFDFMSSKKTHLFTDIIKNYKSHFISTDEIRWYFDIYNNLDEATQKVEKGVFWPENIAVESGSIKTAATGDFGVPVEKADNLTSSNYYLFPEKVFNQQNANPALRDLSGKVFVITVVYIHEFYENIIARFFGEKKRTKNGALIIYSRSVGICG